MSFDGVWPGLVVDNKGERGTVKVRVPQIFGGEGSKEKIPDSELPWARPCMPFVGKGSGFLMVPETGSGVWIMFIGGDPTLPVYLGGWYGEGDEIREFLSSKDFVIKTPLGHKFKMSDGPVPEVLIEDNTGQQIQMRTAQSLFRFLGQHEETVAATKTGTVGGNFSQQVGGNYSLTAGALITITATALMSLFALAGLSITAAGVVSIVGGAAVTISAVGTFKLLSSAVVLGVESEAQKLCNKTLMDLFNAHTHRYNPGPGSPVDTQPPFPSAIEDTHTTVNVKAS